MIDGLTIVSLMVAIVTIAYLIRSEYRDEQSHRQLLVAKYPSIQCRLYGHQFIDDQCTVCHSSLSQKESHHD